MSVHLSRQGRRRARVAGIGLAAGALLPWLGFSSLAQATPTSSPTDGAQYQVVVCHATNSDRTPYQYLLVSSSSTAFQGHLAHRNTPNKTWKHDTMWRGTLYPAGSPKGDLIASYDNVVLDGAITKEICETPAKPEQTGSATSTTTTPSTTTTTTSSTTTSSTTTSSTTTSSTTTSSTTTTTTTTTPSETETATVLPTKATNTNVPSSSSTQGEQVSAENASLPRTGTDAGRAALLSLLLLGTGGVLLRVSGMRLQRNRKH